MRNDRVVIMYVGNLEEYQGIDLLLESFALVTKRSDIADLVIIGGQASDIRKYEQRARQLGIGRRVSFLGPRPVRELGTCLSHADVLVSPRVKGNNTPMKVYSYLHSGKPIVATSLRTHTQVLSSDVAMLAEPTRQEFAVAMLCLIEDGPLRDKLGKAGRQLLEDKYSYATFREKCNRLFDWLETEVA